MKLTIKTVSPVHIGNGEKLYALDYFTDGRYYYRVSQDQFLDFLQSIEGGIDRYSDWIIETEDKLAQLSTRKSGKRDYNQELNYQRERFNLMGFAESIKKKKEFENFIKKPEILKISHQSRDPIRGEIRGQIKDGRNVAYIPGTSIKGSVRTALLYHFLKKHVDKGWLLDSMKDFVRKISEFDHRGREGAKKQMADKIEQAAFYCPMIDQNNKFKGKEEQYDIMKFLSISDAYPKDGFKDGVFHPSEANKSMGLFDIRLYLVDKQRDSRTRSSTFFANEQPQAPHVEGFAQDKAFGCQLSFNLDFLLQIKKQLTVKNEGIKKGQTRVWKGLETKIEQIFGLQIPEIPEGSSSEEIDKIKADCELQVITHITNCIKIFSQAQQVADEKWLEHFIANDKRRQFEDRLNKGFEHLNNHEGHYLMRLGFATGFNGVTDALYFLEDGPLKEIYAEAMSLLLIGDRPGAERQRDNNARKYNRPRDRYIANPDRFPKSRRLVCSGDSIRPMGWVSVQPDIMPQPIAVKAAGNQEPEAPTLQYFKDKLNYKKPPVLYAEVVKSGFPNKVKVGIKDEDSSPILPLMGFRSKLDEGTIIMVKTAVNKKGKLLGVSFKCMA